MGRPKKNKIENISFEIDMQKERMFEGMQSEYGVVIVALFNPYYAFNAFTLAVSLKQHDKNLPIAIVCDSSSISQFNDEQRNIFDKLIDVKTEWTDGGKGYDPYYCKLNLDLASPFKKTLYLDCDIVWSPRKSPIDLINSLNGVSFTSANRKRVSTEDGLIGNFWADIKDYKKHYGMTEIYDLSSEIMYFEKCTKVFQTAREVYKENKMEVNKFGIGYPDEVFLSIAIEKEKIKLHECPFLPLYWQPHYGNGARKHDANYVLDFYGLSLGGNGQPRSILNLSMHMKQDSFNRMRMTTPPYYTYNKSKFSILKRQEL